MGVQILEVTPDASPKSASSAPEKHPLERINFLSFLTVTWITPLLTLGSKQALELTDVWALPARLRAEVVGPKLMTAFKERKGKHRLVRSMNACFGSMYRKAVISMPFQIFCLSLNPLLLKATIRYINNTEMYMLDPFLGITSGWVLAALLVCCSFGTTFSMQWMFMNSSYFGVVIRSALMDTLFRKAVTLSESTVQRTSLGQIMTLVSADLERIFQGQLQLVMLLQAPIVITIASVLLILEVGVAPTCAGLGVVVVFMPMNVIVAKLSGDRKRKMLQLTDARVRFMTEILRGIRIVKLHGWEDSVERHIQSLRVQEVRENNIANQLLAFTMSAAFIVPALIPFFIFVAIVGMGEDLRLEQVFAVLALMNMIRMPMFMIPRCANGVIQAMVSLKRIELFLTIADSSAGKVITVDTTSACVELKDVRCCWGGEEEVKTLMNLAKTAPKGKGKGKGKPSAEPTPLEEAKAKSEGKSTSDTMPLEEAKAKGKGKDASGTRNAGDGIAKGSGKGAPPQMDASKAVINGVSLMVPQGKKVAVVGRVGSGKSSLLSSMLGELVVESGSISRSCPTVPFCSQQPWIQSMTVKENILFGHEEDRELYERVLDAAQLRPDMKILSAGDNTSIGESGINLSGGQKARVALARALYSALRSDSQLVLLDDPLAAVDAFVAHALFKEAFMGLLSAKTVVVTLNSHLDLLASFDSVIVIEEGTIAVEGSLDEVMQMTPWIAEAVGEAQTNGKEGSQSLVSDTDTKPDGKGVSSSKPEEGTKKDSKAVPLYDAEDRAKGRVEFSNFIEWARFAVSEKGGSMAGGCLILFVLLFMFAGAQGVRVAMDMWCAKWAQGQLETEYAITVYAYILCGLAVLIFGRAAFFLTISMRSSRGLHQSVLQKVLAAPINLFFDITPSGRILNRFSGDLNKVDEQLPQQMLVFLQNVFTVIAAVIVCAASSFWVVLGIPPLTFLFVKIVGFFQKSAREVKRLDMISRSPVLQHFSETLRGLSTIRAMDATERFSERFDEFTNENSKVFLAFWMASRWLALRVDSVSAMLQGLVSVLAIALKDDADPVVVGIALVWGFQLSGLLQFVVRNFSEVENTMTGVERLVVYKHVPGEAAFHIEPKPPVSWPRGNIEFRNVVARYRPGLPVVIKDISFKIQQGERVGICGRTGSGKSTVGLLLFRIIEIESGQIFIDGMDTKNIGLQDLRQRIAMIPQDPVLFRMSVRQNIDPFSQYTDERIWTCLRLVCMEEAIKELPDSLAYQCSEGGANFSLGQMQLLCIARALLQEPGLVMMDEATANVDIKSDEIIQRAIRTNFSAATMLTIAHRISTIIDSHKVAVFEAGELKEFGAPHELVRQEGLFHAFVTEARCELGPEPGAETDIDIVESGVALGRAPGSEPVQRGAATLGANPVSL